MIEGAVYHEGKVAVRYYQPIPKLVQVNGKQMVCSVQRGVSLLLVEESDVQPLLDMWGGCCGGKRKIFSLCSQEAFNIWLTGQR